MAREVLTDLIAENRIDSIRIIQSNDPVIGGQPNDNEDEFSSNISARDLACTLKYTLVEIDKINNKPALKVWDSFGDSKTEPGSQRTINEVNRAANTAQTAANLANDKANNAQTAADKAQTKANQVPNPEVDNLIIGSSTTAYKLITIADLKIKLAIPSATTVVQTTGTSTTSVMSQEAVTYELGSVFLNKKSMAYRDYQIGVTYTNQLDSPIFVSMTVLITASTSKKALLKVDNNVVATGTNTASGANFEGTLQTFVMPGQTFQISITGGSGQLVSGWEYW